MLKILRKFHDKVTLMGISQMEGVGIIKLTTDRGDICIKVNAYNPSYRLEVFDQLEGGNLKNPKTAKDYESLAISRMTGEEIEEHMTDKELKEYEQLLER